MIARQMEWRIGPVSANSFRFREAIRVGSSLAPSQMIKYLTESSQTGIHGDDGLMRPCDFGQHCRRAREAVS